MASNVMLSYVPHLAADKPQALKLWIRGVCNGQRVRAAWVIGLSIRKRVPDISITVKSAISMAIEGNLISADDPRRGLVLIANGERMVEPVVYICAPLDLWGEYEYYLL